MSEPITVHIDCPCPNTPHEGGDIVSLRPKLDYASVASIKYAAANVSVEDPDSKWTEVMGVLSEGYILHGVIAWTFVDEHGGKIAVTKGAIRQLLLERPEVALIVGDKADEIYGEQVLLPLAKLAARSSPPMPMEPSTSATNGHSRKPRKRSSPSLTTTTPTGVTEEVTLPLVGASSSSQS
jgi:hypothetical protein